jgi:hypothetical protein
VVGFGGPSKFRDAIRGGFSKGLTNNVRSRGRKTYRVVAVRLPRGHRGIELPRSFSLSLSLGDKGFNAHVCLSFATERISLLCAEL